MVVFVGDKPSSKNTNVDVAFIGTPSHKNLIKWINDLGIINYKLLNSREQDLPALISHREHSFVALGNNASKVLMRLGIKHFKLPHPSPKNRMLNSKDKINLKLAECKKWLQGSDASRI